MSAYHEVTYAYNLPKIPGGWHWKVWEDVVDGLDVTFIRLSDDVGHAVASRAITSSPGLREREVLLNAQEMSAL